MKHPIRFRISALLLALTMALSLCACGVNPQTLRDALAQTQAGSSRNESPEPSPPETSGEKTPDTEAASTSSPAASPGPGPGSEEARQSLQLLRDRLDCSGILFGVAYLGYVGGLFEEGFETGFPQWLWETNEAMLRVYPFIGEIDANHMAGGAGHLYCIVPLDENATVAINRVTWNENTRTEEITQVLYRSETGEPVLLFANLDDIPSQADTLVTITDNEGNTCQWYPTLDEQGCVVPYITEAGNYGSADFTEYGWQGTPSALVPWLADGFEGMTAAGLAGWEEDHMSCWLIQAPVGTSGRSAEFLLVFYPGDETGGTADLYWKYEEATSVEGVWSGFWSIETVLEGPSYVNLTLFHIGGESGTTDGTTYIDETYPCLISPSGLELVIGAGENGICLPFMSPDTDAYLLTLDEG